MPDPIPDNEDFLGHYRLLRKIGSGGMGEVFLAEDTRLDRKAAVKVLHSRIAEDEQKMMRFVQEAKTASALNHPNIITIYEIGSSRGVTFIATEYIEGKTLHERLNDGPLDPREAVEVGVQIASGLAAAHAAGIVHRDIKPENVMLRPDGLVKILDFGIAKLTEENNKTVDAEAATVIEAYTHPGVIIGTVSYMSPEQARGQEVDARSDIFSFGTLMYELLTGRQPFTGETTSHTVVAILEREPPPLSSFIRDYPGEIESIIKRCLAKSAERRFRVNELLEELRQLSRKLEFEAEIFTATNEGSRAATLETPADASKVTKSNAFTPNNLTTELTPLIGRETEIAVLSDMLADPAIRLITLTGIGGTGKTRLAQAVARRSLSLFPDGVFFIDLSSIFDWTLVFTTVAARLNIEEARGRPFIELLTERLNDKKTLLVIDNFEQVLPAADGLYQLSAACAGLKMLVTSRELLNLSVEREFPVGPLPVPPGAMDFRQGLDSIKQFPSLSLFEDRAKNANPGFGINVSNVRSVAQICSRLDGLPLAIELAAARTKVLSVETLAEKLVGSLALLSHGHRDLPERQQTMRGAIGWSYDLLTTNEKIFFRRVSVFGGSFDAEAAEYIYGDDGTLEAIELLTSLLEKSLLERVAMISEKPRFRMLEVVREFAGEILAIEGEYHAAHARHAQYFVLLSEKAEPHIQAAQSAEWLDRLELEHDNLRAAMKWTLQNDTEKAGRLAAATRNFWLLHSHLTEGFSWLKAAAEADAGRLPASARFKLLNAFGLISRFLGRHDTAREAYEEALAAGEKAGDLRGVAVANRGLGLLAVHDSEFEQARTYFEAGLELSRQVGDDFGVAISLNFLGDVARTEGDNAIARRYFEESLDLLRKLDNKVAVSDNLNNLAAAAFSEGDLEASREYFAEAMSIARDLGNKITISISLDGFAALAAREGHHESAIRLASAADRLRYLIGYEIEPAESRFRDAYLLELKNSSENEVFAAAWDAGAQIDVDEAIALAQNSR